MAGDWDWKGALEAIAVQDKMMGRRGSPKALLAGMRGEPKVTKEDVLELQRLIREVKEPASERGIFD